MGLEGQTDGGLRARIRLQEGQVYVEQEKVRQVGVHFPRRRCSGRNRGLGF